MSKFCWITNCGLVFWWWCLPFFAYVFFGLFWGRDDSSKSFSKNPFWSLWLGEFFWITYSLFHDIPFFFYGDIYFFSQIGSLFAYGFLYLCVHIFSQSRKISLYRWFFRIEAVEVFEFSHIYIVHIPKQKSKFHVYIWQTQKNKYIRDDCLFCLLFCIIYEK